MPKSQPSLHMHVPDVWIVSDARNDAALETALHSAPRGSGFIFRHYHLPQNERRARFAILQRVAKARGHTVVLSASPGEARNWGADGVYGSPAQIGSGPAMLRLATAHSLDEIGQALSARANAILLSPVFPTRTHPDAKTLGNIRFRLLARHAPLPIIALGGMNASRAKRLGARKWAAIDSFSDKATRRISKDS